MEEKERGSGVRKPEISGEGRRGQAMGRGRGGGMKENREINIEGRGGQPVRKGKRNKGKS